MPTIAYAPAHHRTKLLGVRHPCSIPCAIHCPAYAHNSHCACSISHCAAGGLSDLPGFIDSWYTLSALEPYCGCLMSNHAGGTLPCVVVAAFTCQFGHVMLFVRLTYLFSLLLPSLHDADRGPFTNSATSFLLSSVHAGHGYASAYSVSKIKKQCATSKNSASSHRTKK